MKSFLVTVCSSTKLQTNPNCGCPKFGSSVEDPRLQQYGEFGGNSKGKTVHILQQSLKLSEVNSEATNIRKVNFCSSFAM